MDPNQIDRYLLARLAGLSAGIAIGAVLGPPLLGGVLGLRNIAASAAFGAVIGAAVGFIAISGFVFMRRRQIDSAIQQAADTVLQETGLPDTIRIGVKNAHVTLEGEVRYQAQRMEAERAIMTIRGVEGITNLLRFAPPAAA